MIKTGLLAVGVAVATFSAPVALAASATTPTAPTTTATNADKDPVICKREDSTGSRLGGKKVCKTKSDWALEDERTKTEMRDIGVHGAASRTPGG